MMTLNIRFRLARLTATGIARRQLWTVDPPLLSILETILSLPLVELVTTFVVIVVLTFPRRLAPGMTMSPMPPTTSLSIRSRMSLGSIFSILWVPVVVQVSVTGLA